LVHGIGNRDKWREKNMTSRWGGKNGKKPSRGREEMHARNCPNMRKGSRTLSPGRGSGKKNSNSKKGSRRNNRAHKGCSDPGLRGVALVSTEGKDAATLRTNKGARKHCIARKKKKKKKPGLVL